MRKEQTPKKEVIEAEVLDERGVPVALGEDAQPKREEFVGARAGFLTGFVALAFSFVMMLVMAVVTVFVIFPLMLLGRLLGIQVKTFRR